MNVDIVNDFFLIKKIMNKGYEKSVCNIEIENVNENENENKKEENDNLVGTGFFCKIPSKDKIFFITCHHNLENIFEKLKKLILKFDYLTEENWEKTIVFDLEKERKIILDKDIDFIAIEVLKNDNINDYITADESDSNESDFKNVKMFISHFPKDKDKEKNKNMRLKFSLGTVNGVSQKNLYMNYSGWTSVGTAGAPIISVENQELIAIHKGSYAKYNFEKTGVGYPMHLIIEKINKEYDEKKIEYKKEVDKEDNKQKDEKQKDEEQKDENQKDEKKKDDKQIDDKQKVDEQKVDEQKDNKQKADEQKDDEQTDDDKTITDYSN